jgi:hypothetical protein
LSKTLQDEDTSSTPGVHPDATVDIDCGIAVRHQGARAKAAIDTVWVLMDPVVFDRLTRQRHWTLERYQGWFAGSIRRLLLADTPPPRTISARSST